MPVHIRPIVKGLNKPSADRNKSDNEALCDYFKDIKCFKDLNFGMSDLLKVVQVSTLTFVPKQQVLFRIGELGLTFYICLSGKCQLFIANPELGSLKIQKKELKEQLSKELIKLESIKRGGVHNQ